jgi:hypothetical protein
LPAPLACAAAAGEGAAAGAGRLLGLMGFTGEPKLIPAGGGGGGGAGGGPPGVPAIIWKFESPHHHQIDGA